MCCVLSTALAQYWTGPYQLTTDTFADVNPSACREWVNAYATCTVWQTNRNGNWDVYSRFCDFFEGNGWGDETPVCRDSADDVNPVVACCNDSLMDPSFWCFWERRSSPAAGAIMASFSDGRDSWGSAETVGRCLHSVGDSSEPSAIVIRNDTTDTAWVVWVCHDTHTWFVEYSFNGGDGWTPPGIICSSTTPIHHARLGRGRHGYSVGNPLAVWEQNGDIYFSQYLAGTWSDKLAITQSAAFDRNPEILSFIWVMGDMGPAVVWESTQEGDTAIFGTTDESLTVFCRWCDSSGAGNHWIPGGTPTVYTTFVPPWGSLCVWVSDRDNNRNIYSRGVLGSSEDVWVDDDGADDLNPTLTTMGLTMNWCLWQSNRTGNWDIWGSYVYCVGIGESGKSSGFGVRRTATIARGVLSLPVSPFTIHRSLFDMTGRQVMVLRVAANDVSKLVPGVYFVREQSVVSSQHSGRSAVGGERSAVHKVVLAK